MLLNNLIFHELETTQHSTQVDVNSFEEYQLPSANADRLVNEALESFSSESTIAYAQFGHGWFPDRLRQFLDGNIGFEEFSDYAVQDMRSRLEREPLTTGGYLFLIYYTDGNSNYILTLLLKDIEGLIINNGDIEESHILDLDKLHFAALVNIDSWENPQDDLGCISFLKGRSRSEVTAYFKDYLCIDDDTFNDPVVNTKSLVQVIMEYCKDAFDDEEIRFSARNRVYTAILQKINQNEEITLEEVANLVNPTDNQSFIDYINQSDYAVQPEFMANKTALRKLTRYSGRNSEISISFENSALESGRIQYLPANQEDGQPAKLIIHDIPQNLLQDLDIA